MEYGQVISASFLRSMHRLIRICNIGRLIAIETYLNKLKLILTPHGLFVSFPGIITTHHISWISGEPEDR